MSSRGLERQGLHAIAWIAFFLLSACAHSHGSAESEGAAAPASTGPFRAFEPPPPLALGEPPEVSGKCSDESAFEQETTRETAALDASLRHDGGMLLSATLVPIGMREDEPQEGTIMRGPKGERWLVVSETHSCNPYIPRVAMSASHEVYQAMPQMKAKETRDVRLCSPICGGCGIQGEPAAVVVEVPAGAHLGATRAVTFSIDVALAFKALDEDGKPMRCMPPP